MAIGRSRFAPPYVSTKGHSVLKQRSYAMPTRNPPASSVSRVGGAYDTRAEEYLLADRVSNVNYLSNTLMDEGYDTALKSRGRDQQLLRDATNAIVSSESYATPQTSVASRRVARGQSVASRAASVPPRPLRAEVDTTTTASQLQAPPKRPIVILPAPGPGGNVDRAMSVPPVVVFREDQRQRAPIIPRFTREERRSIARGRSVPPAVAPYARRGPYWAPEKRVAPPVQPVREALPTAGLKAHMVPRRFPTRTSLRFGSSSSGLLYTPPRPRPAPLRESLRDFPRVFVPSKGQRPSNRSKAAIIASKMEPDPIKRRRPRSEYAANKYRELRKEASEGGPQSQGSGQHGSSHKSSYVQSTRKVKEEDDDQPNPLMSWKYRLDSMLSPSDLLYKPSSLIRIREQLKDAQEKMGRHRDMLDKYLPEGGADTGDVAASIRRKTALMESRDPSSDEGADLPLATRSTS